MADDAGPFQKADDLSDLVLLVDGGELYVHKLMLMLHSPVFKCMLSSDFAEKDASEIALPGKTREDFVEFLKQIYAMYSCNSINDDNVEGVLSLADEYQVDQVTIKCRNFIQQQTSKVESLSFDQVLFYHGLSDRYHFDDVKSRLVQHVMNVAFAHQVIAKCRQQTDELKSLSVDQVLFYLGLSDLYHFDDVKSRLVQHVQNVVSAKDAAKSPFYNMVDVTLMRDVMQSKVVAGLQERAIHYVDKTSHEKLRQDNIRLTKENQQLKSTISSLERTVASLEHRVRRLEGDKSSSFSLGDNYRKTLLLILVIVGAIFF